MDTGTRRFDNIDYPDAHASDARELAWMTGSPPPQDKRIVFEGDNYLQFPQLRWSFSHMRELAATANVWRGPMPASSIGEAPHAHDEAGIDSLRFTDMNGVERSWLESLHETYTDGIVVLHRGKRVYERYFGVLRPERPHILFSATKSYVATLAATLIQEGTLDENKPVPHYLPEFAGTAYADATLRNVMDMQVGLDYSEVYADPASSIWNYSRASGFRDRPQGYAGPRTLPDYLLSLRKQGEHGKVFAYKTPCTDVLAWVMKRATGVGLAEMLSQRLWSPLGCEQDGYLMVDSAGTPMAGGGLNASLRDMARFGEAMRCEGAWQGHQRIPAAVVADIRRGGDPEKFAPAGYVLLKGYSYRSMWWVSHNPVGAFEARGIHGQRIYVAPKSEVVIARFASHPVAGNFGNDPITLPACLALAQALGGR